MLRSCWWKARSWKAENILDWQYSDVDWAKGNWTQNVTEEAGLHWFDIHVTNHHEATTAIWHDKPINYLCSGLLFSTEVICANGECVGIQPNLFWILSWDGHDNERLKLGLFYGQFCSMGVALIIPDLILQLIAIFSKHLWEQKK